MTARHTPPSTLHPYRVRCAGLEFDTLAASSCAAMIAAFDLHGVPASSARRLA